jgi:hypothetical protein
MPPPPLQVLPGVLAAHTHLDGSGRHGDARASARDLAPPVALATASTNNDSAAASNPAGAAGEEDPAVLYVRGLLAWASGARGEGLALLERSVEAQLARVEDLPPGLELFSRLEAGRALGVARRLVAARGADPRRPGEAPAPALVKGIRCVGLRCPPHHQAHGRAPRARKPRGLPRATEHRKPGSACWLPPTDFAKQRRGRAAAHGSGSLGAVLTQTRPSPLPAPSSSPLLPPGGAARILEALGRFTGQLPEATRLYARALFLNGSLDAAARKAGEALRGAPGDAGGAPLGGQHLRAAGAGGARGGSVIGIQNSCFPPRRGSVFRVGSRQPRRPPPTA